MVTLAEFDGEQEELLEQALQEQRALLRQQQLETEQKTEDE